MISYGKFSFAAPPRCGASWFLRAAQLAGLGPGFLDRAYTPFAEERRPGEFRISLIRHPCSWLVDYYHSLVSEESVDSAVVVPGMVSFMALPASSFGCWIEAYLADAPGAVGRLFAEYKADSVIRCEDLPDGFYSLLGIIGVEENMALLFDVLKRPRSRAPHYEWPRSLRRRVLDAESEMVERYEYDW